MGKVLDDMMAAANKIKEDFPFAGMEVLESPFIPEGTVVLQSDTQMAILDTASGKAVILSRDKFPTMKPEIKT